jgi:hypothetical protein
MSSNGASNGSVAVATPEPPDGNIWSRRRIGRAQSEFLSRVRYHRSQLEAANDRTLAAIDETREAQTILDAERLRTDPASKRSGSLPVAVFVAIVVALVDLLPAYWAAQALGESETDTRIVTVILVAGLTGFAALMSHFRNRRELRMFYASMFFTALLIAVQSGLRFRFLRVVTDANLLDATLQAALLACVSGGLVWIGYVKLVSAEPWSTYGLRRELKSLQRRLDGLRGDLKDAGDEYLSAYESLRHLEDGRVGRDDRLAVETKDELGLQRQLIAKIQRASVANGPIDELPADGTPQAGDE